MANRRRRGGGVTPELAVLPHVVVFSIAFRLAGECAHAAETADPGMPTDQRLSDSQLVAALEHCLAEVGGEVRMVLVMRFTEGFAYEDIARICGARPEAVRARVCRAMPVLRRCIEHRGVV